MVQLSPPQTEIMASEILSSGFNCILQMPTGSGKTWLAEQTIGKLLAEGSRVIYLTPLRALATELMGKWQERFAGYKVGVFTGDYGIPGRSFPIPFREAQLLIMTPERLDACTRNWRSHWSWIPEVDLIIVDEFHLLGDKHRGARLEGTLSRMRRLNPFIYIHGLSATLGNREELADWLEGIEYSSNWRPIPIEWKILRYDKPAEKLSLLLQELQHNLKSGGKSLVFVQSRRRAEQLCRQLQEQNLQVCHHHAGMDHASRKGIEERFRQGHFDIIIATSTLEMGINFPVRQVVLYDLQFFNGVDFCPLPTNNVWQRVGRAGRKGLDSIGEAVLLAAKWDKSATDYEKGQFEAIYSGLSATKNLAEQIIIEIGSGLAKTQAQLVRVFDQSLAAYQKRLPNIAKTLSDMLRVGMVREIQDERGNAKLKATRLGYIAIRHLLCPHTVLLFQNVLQTNHSFTFFDLLILACSSEDCEPILAVDFEELDCLADSTCQESSSLLHLPYCDITRLLEIGGKRLLAAIKTAIVARSWTRLTDAAQVAEQCNCYPFEVSKLCESLERLLLAMTAIFSHSEEKQDNGAHYVVLIEEKIAILQKMMAAGLDEEKVTLTLVKGIGGKIAQKMVAIGIEDIEDLAAAEPEELSALPGISTSRAEQWIDEAKALIKTHSAYRYRETETQSGIETTCTTQWPQQVDPYRLRRALELKIAGKDGNNYRVVGGLEPHLVRLKNRQYHCDCADFAKGNTCKHILKVRLYRKEKQLCDLVHQLDSESENQRLNLFDLWWDKATIEKRRSIGR